MSAQMTLWGTRKPTSSPGSEDGLTRCVSLDGLTTNPFGPALAPANPSPTPGKVLERPTSGTYGRRCSGSSKSVALQSCLESRLTVLMAGLGSPLYALTWKTQAMPWGGGIIPAAGVGAPHTRDRIFWVAANPGRVRGAGLRLAGGAGKVRSWGTFGPMDLREIIDRPFDPGARFSRPRALAISDGIPARVGRLRAYGNAIVPQVGAVFVRAVMDCIL